MYALFKRTLADAWLLLLLSSVLLFGFTWLFIVLMDQVEFGSILLQFTPKFVLRMIGLPEGTLDTKAAQYSFVYVDLVTVATTVGWAITRGSDVVSGQISRGTMELLLAQPVRRSWVLLVHVGVTAVGSAILAAAIWVGTWAGLETLGVKDITAWRFVPGAVNIFCFMVALTGITALASSLDSERWRTIGIAGGVFVLSSLVKVVARLWEDGEWLIYFSLLGALEPQKLIVFPADEVWDLSLQYNGALLAVGLVTHVAALIIFNRRDLPAPL